MTPFLPASLLADEPDVPNSPSSVDESSADLVVDVPSAEGSTEGSAGGVAGGFVSLTNDEIVVWVDKLGSATADIREQAADQLYRAGRTALPTLKQFALENGDFEVQSRCRLLIKAIEQDDLGRRTDEFLRESDPTKIYGFEGWPSFSKVVGPGRLTKRLFKEIIDTQPAFAENSFDDPNLLRTETEKIGRDILFSLRKGDETRLGDIVTLMFASIKFSGNIPRDIELTTSTLTRRAPFPQEIQSTVFSTPLRTLFREWLKTTSSEPQMVMITCMELGIDDGKQIARKVLADKQTDVDSYDIAMSSMMRFATFEDLPWIEPWCVDDRPMRPPFRVQTNIPSVRQLPGQFRTPDLEKNLVPFDPKVEVQVQFRDLALVVCLKLMQEEVINYYPRCQWHPFRGYLANSLAQPVADPDARKAIIDRWNEWKMTRSTKSDSANDSSTEKKPETDSPR